MQSDRTDKSTLHPLQLVLHNALLKVVKHVLLGKLGKDRATALLPILCNQLTITFCECNGKKLLQLLPQHVTFYFS